MKLSSSSRPARSEPARTGTWRASGHLGVAVVALSVALGALGGLGSATGCAHDAKPVAQPDDQAPALPPASGTPIGYLIDTSELKLSDDQLAKLKVIDDDLATKLMYVESMQRSASEPEPAKERSRGRAGFGASTGDSGMGEWTPNAPVSGDKPVYGSSGAPQPTSGDDKAATLERVPKARASVVRTAIARALAVLDAGQSKLARQVLKDRGVDPDTGRFEATGEPGRSRGSADGGN
jgi:hypothetical protein